MPKPPNVLILLADQLRYDALSCNGAPVCRTPAMDSVAAAGVRFASAFTPIALCTPARASLLTGCYPHNHRQLSNMGNFNGVFDEQLVGQPTLLSRLAAKPATGSATRESGICRGRATARWWGVHRWHTPGEWMRSLDRPDYDFARQRGATPGVGRVRALRRP